MKTTLVAIFALSIGLFAARVRANDTVYYYYNDAQGSPVAVADASGNVVETTEYSPYGQTLNRPVHDGPGYTGHEEDSATGLNYMQQRYYDPQSGQFISTDPVLPDGGTGASFNRYAYANDNPYRYVDLDGRCADGSSCDTMVQSYAADEMANPDRPLTPVDQVILAVGMSASGLDGAAVAEKVIGALADVAKVAKVAEAAKDVERGAAEASKAGALPKPSMGPGKVPVSERDPKRLFTPAEREAKRAEQNHLCANGCGTKIDNTNSVGHHIKRHADGGRTISENHAEVCIPCHKALHSKEDRD